MKRNVIRLIGLLGALMLSNTALAHAGVHGEAGFSVGVLHILMEHGHLLAVGAVGVAAIALKRLLRA